MKQFTFRLETLARLREREEEEARKSLALCISATQDALKARDLLCMERERLDLEWQAALKTATAGAAVVDFEKFRAVLELRLQESERAVKEAQKKEMLARKKMGEAMQNRKVIEKLREKKRREFETEQLRIENKEMEDCALGRHVRARREEAMNEDSN